MKRAFYDKIFNVAKAVSELSDYPRTQMGAVVIDKKGSIIAVGKNHCKSHPDQKKYNRYRSFEEGSFDRSNHYLHAEMDALLKLKNEPIGKKTAIFVFRKKGKNDANGMARPCPACMEKIKEMGIREIHYTTDNGVAVEYLDL